MPGQAQVLLMVLWAEATVLATPGDNFELSLGVDDFMARR